MLPDPKSSKTLPYAKRLQENLKQKIVPKIPDELRFSQDALIRQLNAPQYSGGICAALACLYHHLRRNDLLPAEAINALKFPSLGQIAVAAYADYQQEVKKHQDDKVQKGAKLGRNEVCQRITNLFSNCNARMGTSGIMTEFVILSSTDPAWQPSGLEFHQDVDLLESGIATQAVKFLDSAGKDFKEGSLFSKKTITFASHGKKLEDMLPAIHEQALPQLLYLRLESPRNNFAHAISMEYTGRHGYMIFDPNVGLIPTKRGMNVESVGTLLSMLLAIYEITSMYVFANVKLPPAQVGKPLLERKVSKLRS